MEVVLRGEVMRRQADWERVLRQGTYAEIESVAVETFSRIGRALDVLQQRLGNLGYPTSGAITPPDDALNDRIAQLEAVDIALPPSLRQLWLLIGGVSLLDLDGYRHDGFWSTHGVVDSYPDGLHIDYCDDAYVAMVMDDHCVWLDSPPGHRENSSFGLTVAPDPLHKENISGGSPYEITSSTSWSAPLRNLVWTTPVPNTVPSGDCDLVSYLRTAILECGGFPGLYGQALFERLRRELTDGLPAF
ncbi:MAG: hypothetical protein AAFU79_31895 [Myxococcota bacterium]